MPLFVKSNVIAAHAGPFQCSAELKFDIHTMMPPVMEMVPFLFFVLFSRSATEVPLNHKYSPQSSGGAATLLGWCEGRAAWGLVWSAKGMGGGCFFFVQNGINILTVGP